jgi:hypothetical protein
VPTYATASATPFTQREVTAGRILPVAGGVSLAKPGDVVVPAPAPSPVVYRPCVSFSGNDCWDRVWASPRASIEAWVADCLRTGDYESASHLSGYLHAPRSHGSPWGPGPWTGSPQ